MPSFSQDWTHIHISGFSLRLLTARSEHNVVLALSLSPWAVSCMNKQQARQRPKRGACEASIGSDADAAKTTERLLGLQEPVSQLSPLEPRPENPATT